MNFPPKRTEKWHPEGYEVPHNTSTDYTEYIPPTGKMTKENLYFKINHLNHTKELFDEMITKMNAGEERNETVVDLHFQCKELQKEISSFLQENGVTCQEHIFNQLLQLNDSLGNSISKYEKILKDPTVLETKRRKKAKKEKQETKPKTTLKNEDIFDDDEDPLDCIFKRERGQQPQLTQPVNFLDSLSFGQPEKTQIGQPQTLPQQVFQPQILQPQAQILQPRSEIFQPQILQPQILQPQILQPQILQPQILQPQAQILQPRSEIFQPQILQPQILQPQIFQPQAQILQSQHTFQPQTLQSQYASQLNK